MPTLNLNLDTIDGRESSSRKQRVGKRNQRSLVLDLLRKDEQNSVIKPEIQSETHTENNRYEILLQRYNMILEENKQLRQQCLENKGKIITYETQITLLEKRIEELLSKMGKTQQLALNEHIKNTFSGVLSESQLNMIINKKKYVKWTPDDISSAFTIRYFSKRCYIYLRQTLHYPLPGISSLQRWASNLNLRMGILPEVIRIMKIMGHTLSNFEKVTVLSYDEMKVSSIYEYDQKEDEVLGPHSYMQIIMARGLFSKWKQPVYIGFDSKMTKDILNSVIIELQNNGYNVVACGGGNIGLWKELSISMNSSSYPHPVTQQPVYFFADAPHLLKLIRNWFLDNGFILDNRQKVTSAPVEELVKLTNSEINSCHKLTPNHIHCEKSKRQNVQLAAQLLSHSTATALKHYKPGPDKMLAETTGEFIELVNQWFDIMNSYHTKPSVPTKMPYGLCIEEQNEVLKKMETLMSTSLCIGKNTLQTFQKAVIISVKSLQLLYQDMVHRHDIKYILTHRLNQDLLENLFSQIRTRGGLNDHPSPLDCIYRLRMIILGKNPGIVQKQANTVDVDAGEYLIAKALNKANITVTESSSPLSESETVYENNLQPESSTINVTNQSEEDGLMYVAGYVAHKFRDKYPDLGDHTNKLQVQHDYLLPTWVKHLSYGGLINPSQSWIRNFQIISSSFTIFHGENNIQRGKNILNLCQSKCLMFHLMWLKQQ